MFTKEALLKAKIDLYNITVNLAYEDYLKANYKNGKRKSKKHISYSLSDDTEQARLMYKMVYGKDITDITEEQEEQIKAFLLPYRTTRTEFLREAGGTNYFIGGNY